MSLAIFGITNDGLNLVATLFLLMLVVLWLALIVYTYLDARRRISDPFLVACATVASFFPFIGTAVYAIVRPPEFLEDAHERELEIKAAELRVRQLQDQTCPNCEYPVEQQLSCAAPTASAASRTPARPAASRSTRAGAFARSARPRWAAASAAADRAAAPPRASARGAPRAPRRRRRNAP